jgi:ankyrin repeat protein
MDIILRRLIMLTTYLTIHPDDPLGVAVVEVIQKGNLETLKRLLRENPGLATARLGDDIDSLGEGGMLRSLLHVVTDWPGHFPNGAATVAALVEAGADVNARFVGPHNETPLHWAASSDDVGVLDALLDAGADIDAPGGVIGSSTPLADARAFKQWKAAYRLVERGAQTTLVDAATLGLMNRIENFFASATPPAKEDVTSAFWGACHGGQQQCAEYLLDRGAELNWIPEWEALTPLDAAHRSDATDLVRWLRSQGAKSAKKPE